MEDNCLEKLIVPQIVKKYPPFIEPDVLLCSQDMASLLFIVNFINILCTYGEGFARFA
jgi:hypothetical protein